jgi:hypothetical protein
MNIYIIETKQSNDSFPYPGDLFQLPGEYVGISGINIITINLEVNYYIMIMPSQQNVSLFRNVISSLLRNRDFLGYQLSLYQKNLSKKQFDKISKEYLVHNDYDVNVLASNIYSLIKNTERDYNADEISTMFQCDIDVAEDALTKLENSLTT